jgi:hypothetical protein
MNMIGNTHDDTGKWLREVNDIEHDAENGVCIEFKDGRWIVGGVVVVETFCRALELAIGEAA